MAESTNISPNYPNYLLNADTVTPSDATVFAESSVIYAGVGGDIAVKTTYGTNVTFLNVPTGSTVPVQVKMVLATGTTATNLVRVF